MENLVFSCGCLFIIVNWSIGERGLLYICCIVITSLSDFSSVLLLQSEPHHWCYFLFLLHWQQKWTLGRAIQVPMSVCTYCQTLSFLSPVYKICQKTLTFLSWELSHLSPLSLLSVLSVFIVFALTMPYFLIATLTLCTISHIIARTHLTGVVSVWSFNFLNLWDDRNEHCLKNKIR